MQWKCAEDLRNTNGWEQFLICGDGWADVQRTQAGHEAVTRCGLDQSTMLTASLSTGQPIGWSKTAFWNAKPADLQTVHAWRRWFSEATLAQLFMAASCLLSEQEWYDFSRKFRSTFPGHAVYLEWTEYSSLHTLD